MAKKQTANLPVQFDAELARQAQAYRDAESASATGNFISVRGGIMQWRGAPIEGNKLDCLILASVFENDYYKEGFDADNPTPPSCYAFSRTQDGLKPHEAAEDPQGDANHLCAACWANGVGSGVDARGKPGRGKACQNRRRLAIIPGGDLTEAGVKAAELAYFRVPVMSVPGYSNHVMQIADMFKLPPFGVVTELSLVPDPKSQFRVIFKAKAQIKDRAVLGALFGRASDAANSIQFPYPKASEMAHAPTRSATKKAAAGKKTAGAKGAAAARRF